MAWFFALTCTVKCGMLYREVCAFPNHVQSIEFTTGRNISRMTNEAPVFNFESHSKGSEYLKKKMYIYIIYICRNF